MPLVTRIPVAIRYMPGHGGVDDVLAGVIAPLKEHDCEITKVTVPRSDITTKPEQLKEIGEQLRHQQLVIALGGDGTLLSTARLVAGSGVPVLGLNLKGLGFLTATTADRAADALAAFFDGTMLFEERRMLSVAYSIPQKETLKEFPFAALNDVALVRGVPTRMIQLEVLLDGHFLTSLEADGLILATPTGSTAYSLAGGGSIFWPELDIIGITPIMPHALSIRPIVVPGETVIEIRGLTGSRGQPHLSVDGHTIELQGSRPCVRVTRSPLTTRLCRLPGTNFGDILREKLVWGGRLRHGE